MYAAEAFARCFHRCLAQEHARRTGSAKAQQVLAKWDDMLPRFWQLVPPAEKNTPLANPNIAPIEAPGAKVAVSA